MLLELVAAEDDNLAGHMVLEQSTDECTAERTGATGDQNPGVSQIPDFHGIAPSCHVAHCQSPSIKDRSSSRGRNGYWSWRLPEAMVPSARRRDITRGMPLLIEGNVDLAQNGTGGANDDADPLVHLLIGVQPCIGETAGCGERGEVRVCDAAGGISADEPAVEVTALRSPDGLVAVVVEHEDRGIQAIGADGDQAPGR